MQFYTVIRRRLIFWLALASCNAFCTTGPAYARRFPALSTATAWPLKHPILPPTLLLISHRLRSNMWQTGGVTNMVTPPVFTLRERRKQSSKRSKYCRLIISCPAKYVAPDLSAPAYIEFTEVFCLGPRIFTISSLMICWLCLVLWTVLPSCSRSQMPTDIDFSTI